MVSEQPKPIHVQSYPSKWRQHQHFHRGWFEPTILCKLINSLFDHNENHKSSNKRPKMAQSSGSKHYVGFKLSPFTCHISLLCFFQTVIPNDPSPLPKNCFASPSLCKVRQLMKDWPHQQGTVGFCDATYFFLTKWIMTWWYQWIVSWWYQLDGKAVLVVVKGHTCHLRFGLKRSRWKNHQLMVKPANRHTSGWYSIHVGGTRAQTSNPSLHRNRASAKGLLFDSPQQ